MLVVFAFNPSLVVAVTGLVFYGLTHPEIYSDGGNTWFHLIQVVGVLGVTGTLVVLGNAVHS